MAIPSFYHPELNAQDTLVTLSHSEGAHAVKSRRLREGQEIRLLNGKGLIASATISMVDGKAVEVDIDLCQQHPKPAHGLSMVVAVPKGDRQKVMVDMLTQLGASQIVPLNCEHSVTRYRTNMHEKWERWAVEACKQSQNPWLPEIAEDINVLDFVSLHLENVFFADAQGESIAQAALKLEQIIILIGPEGGFSPSEQSLFKEHNIKSISLAPHVLRTEAAAVVAASQWQSITL